MTLDWKSFALGAAVVCASVAGPLLTSYRSQKTSAAPSPVTVTMPGPTVVPAADSQDNPDLRKAVHQADAILGVPNDKTAWEKLPLAQRAAVDLGSYQVQLASQRRQIQAYELYVKTLQDQAKLIEADAEWQAVVRKNQQQSGGQEDPMVTLLNVIRPGLGSTLKKLHDASQKGIPE